MIIDLNKNIVYSYSMTYLTLTRKNKNSTLDIRATKLLVSN